MPAVADEVLDDAPPWDEETLEDIKEELRGDIDASTAALEELAPPVDATRTTGGARIVLVDTPRKLAELVEDARTWPIISIDVETAHLAERKYDEKGKAKKERLDFNRLALRSIQIGNERVVYVVDCALVPDWHTPDFVRLLEEHPKLVAHNAPFEYKVMKRHGVTLRNIMCTMYAEKVRRQGLKSNLSLAGLVDRYLGREMLKDVRDTFIEEREVKPLRPEQIRYAADDVDCLVTILREQWRVLAERGLLHVAEFEWGRMRDFAEISLRGVYLNEDRWQALIDENTINRDRVHEEIFNIFKPAAIRRWERLLWTREEQRNTIEGQLTTARETGWPVEKVADLEEKLKALPSWLKVRPNKETGVREPKKTAMWDFDKVLSSPMQLKAAFSELGLELRDTDEGTLLKVKRTWAERAEAGETPPTQALEAIDRLLEFRGLDKKISTYGQNWINAVSPASGFIHAEYDTLKDTARTGCSDPNIQNVPKREEGKVYRQAFTLPELIYIVENQYGARIWADERGLRYWLAWGARVVDSFVPVYVVADYSQIELRVAAEMSGDKNMIAAFQSGLDIHLATASLMFNLPPEQISKDQRSAAKAVNFGILFGIGPAKLAEDLTNSTKAPVTVETAKGFLRMYGKSYPRLMSWLQSTGTTAREVMYTTTMFGHIRRFDPPVRPVAQDFAGDPEGYAEAFDKYKGRLSGIEREGKNTPIQGTAAVIAKTAIAELERILPQYDAGIVLFVHDEIGVITSEFYAEEVAQVVKATMEEAGRKYMKRVPCLAEVDYGVNWLCEGFAEAA